MMLRLPLTNEFLRNLHGVGRRAFADIVRTAPEVDSVFNGEIAAETTNIDGVCIRGVDRHRVDALFRIVLNDQAFSALPELADVRNFKRLFEFDVDALAVTVEHRYANGGRRDAKRGQLKKY